MTSSFSALLDWVNGVFMPYLLGFSGLAAFIQRLPGLG
jgi:hypothetical protein